MRVHFLITDLQIGGTPRVVKELAIRLRPYGFDTAVGCLAPWGPVADELAAAGVPVTAFDATRATRLPRTVGRVRRWADGADVLFGFLVHANTVATLARTGHTRLLQSVQTTQPWPRWHWWVQGLIGPVAERIVVPSASVVRKLADAGTIGRVTVVPNAVDLPPMPAAGGRRPGPWRVGFVGRLDPVKCVPDLIAAVARLEDAELHVYGDGEDRPNVVAAIEAHGLRSRVTLHGRVPSAAAALAAIDVLVLPSLAEGFGLVLIEAMAAGVPVVATRVAGIVDVVNDGRTGLLVPPHAPAALAEAVARVRRDSTLRTALIRDARADAERRFAWTAVLPQYAELLCGTADVTDQS